MVTEIDVLQSLKEVIYPNFKKDIVTFGFVKKVKIGESELNVTVDIPSSNENTKEVLKREIDNCLKKFGDIKKVVNINTPELKDEHTSRPVSKNIAPGIKNFVMVSSGKGGVGKSTTSVNLSISLAKSGKKVGLLDADIYGPNIPRMLGLHDKKPLVDASGKKLIPLEVCGIKMMSMGVLYDKGQSLIWRGPMIMRAIEQMLADVCWDDLDVLVIDMPPGTGDAQLTLAQSVPVSAGISVTTPQMVAVDDSIRALDMFKRLNIPIAGVVENMSYFACPDNNISYEIFGSGNIKGLLEEFGTSTLARIPIEPNISASCDNGKPVAFYNPDSESAKAYMNMAYSLLIFLDKVKADNSKIQPVHN